MSCSYFWRKKQSNECSDDIRYMSSLSIPIFDDSLDAVMQVPIAMERLSIAPDEDAGQENEEGGPNHILVISDCNGRCEFVSLLCSTLSVATADSQRGKNRR